MQRRRRSSRQRPTYIFVHDFTGDGIADYLFSEGNYQGRGRPNVFREAGQAHVDIYVVDRAGTAARVYRERLIGYRILDQRPRVVQIAQQGAACGANAAATAQCGASLRWNQSTGRFVVEPTGSRASADAAVERPAQAAAGGASGANPTQLSAAEQSLLTLALDIASWSDQPTPAQARNRLSGVRWSGDTGRFGDLEVQLFSATGRVDAVHFSWVQRPGQSPPYDLLRALQLQGARRNPDTLRLLSCH